MNKLASYEGHQEAIAKLREHATALGLNLSAWFEPLEIPTVGTSDEGTITCPHCGDAQEDIEVACSDGLAYLASFDDGVWAAYADYATDNEIEPLACYCLKCNGWFDPERVVLR